MFLVTFDIRNHLDHADVPTLLLFHRAGHMHLISMFAEGTGNRFYVKRELKLSPGLYSSGTTMIKNQLATPPVSLCAKSILSLTTSDLI